MKINNDVILAIKSIPYGDKFSNDFLNAVATVDQLSTATIASKMDLLFSFIWLNVVYKKKKPIGFF